MSSWKRIVFTRNNSFARSGCESLSRESRISSRMRARCSRNRSRRRVDLQSLRRQSDGDRPESTAPDGASVSARTAGFVDDLKVLAETSLAPKQLRANPDLALKIVDTILLGLDCRRFPWRSPGREREATDDERASAVLASAALLATRRVETIRRNLGKQSQEERVKQTLRDAGFTEVKRRTMDHLSKAPQPGEFCRDRCVKVTLGDDRNCNDCHRNANPTSR